MPYGDTKFCSQMSVRPRRSSFPSVMNGSTKVGHVGCVVRDGGSSLLLGRCEFVSYDFLALKLRGIVIHPWGTRGQWHRLSQSSITLHLLGGRGWLFETRFVCV